MASEVLATMMRGAMPKLPYDAEIEYIQGSGSSMYIDTGIIRGFSRVSWKIVMESTYGGYNGVFGAKFSDSFIGLYFNPWFTYPTLRIVNGANSSKSKEESLVSFFGNVSTEDIELLETMKLFKCGDLVNTKNFDFKFYSFSLSTQNGIDDVIDLTPVRFTNDRGETEGAMYDRVSKQLFRNSGTGAFIIGHDKQTFTDNLGVLMPQKEVES